MNDRETSGRTELEDTVAILVHHRNYSLIGPTTAALVAQGFDPRNVLVVDNSEDADQRALLIGILPQEVRTIFVPNKGYGNAVNVGIQFWAGTRASGAPKYVLVATHEVMPRPGSVSELRSALEARPAAAAAGPTLISGRDDSYIWSTGGHLTKRLRIPRHFDHRASFHAGVHAGVGVTDREWLDGAFVLYRWAAIDQVPFDEAYFMYMEETDLHLRLRKAGHVVIWVPAAVVWQSSGGIPAYYLSRNLRLLYLRTGRRLLGTIAVPAEICRRTLADAVKRRTARDNRELIRGFFALLPKRAPAGPAGVIILNPLGGALFHYQKELLSVLAETGHEVRWSHAIREPSVSGERRGRWLLRYARALRSARNAATASTENTRLVITWPVLGYLDAILIAIFYRRPAWIIFHDPEPLVRAVGYDKISRYIGRHLCANVRLIVHSTTAREAVARGGVVDSAVLLPHPILAPGREAGIHLVLNGQKEKPLVRVLGQFKPDRDLDALRVIGAHMGGWARLEIYGRGWPNIDGWSVTEGFLSEFDMTARLSEADVILIPYARFFQSGVAIRALEAGVAVVGPRVASLINLFGPDSQLLVDASASNGAATGEAWVKAIQWALDHGKLAAQIAGTRVHRTVVDDWATWMNENQFGSKS